VSRRLKLAAASEGFKNHTNEPTMLLKTLGGVKSYPTISLKTGGLWSFATMLLKMIDLSKFEVAIV
jgi:hypothetical protein